MILSEGSVAVGKSKRDKVVAAARNILEEAQVSYVYGGYKLGDWTECQSCNSCLENKKPAPKQRLLSCPICRQCSIDCSHFTQLVLTRAGLRMPYLTTKTMLQLSAQKLRKLYQLVDLGRQIEVAAPGDLLVYKGHVVLLEKKTGQGRGDVIHATGGKDIKLPGQGVQRERMVPLNNFRGPLLRILRHVGLTRRKLRPL